MSRPPPSESMIVAAPRSEGGGLGQLLVSSRPRGLMSRLVCTKGDEVSLDVHEAGLVRRDRSGELTLTWPEIFAVYEVLEEVETPIGTRLEPKVILQSSAGQRVVVDRSLSRHVDIGRIVASRAQDAMLSRCEALLAFGRRVELGPIALDPFGLHTPDSTHAWASIAFVRWDRLVYRGSFSIHLLDGSLGARVPSEYVQNPRVLLSLLERQGKLEDVKEALIAAVLGAA